jgi:ATP-dependent DNA helicase PIF1
MASRCGRQLRLASTDPCPRIATSRSLRRHGACRRNELHDRTSSRDIGTTQVDGKRLDGQALAGQPFPRHPLTRGQAAFLGRLLPNPTGWSTWGNEVKTRRLLGWLFGERSDETSPRGNDRIDANRGSPEADPPMGLDPVPRREFTSQRRFGDFNASLPTQARPSDGRSGFRRDEAYECSPGVKEALEAIDGGAPAVLISGRAGTGKTTLIRYLRQRPGGERQVIVAPTAVAALNAQAQTIHSFFHLPHLILDPSNLPDGRNFGVLYRRMSRLVVDEISMVRVDLIDAIDVRLRAIRGDPRPFGGVQFVMVGDFLQLPPVVERDHWPLLHGLGYKSPYAFSARALESLPVMTISLEQVYRQDEQEFIDMLSRVRLGQDSAEVVFSLNERCLGPHRPEAHPLLLVPTRAAAERYNREGLAALAGPASIMHAQIIGKLEIDKDRLPVPEHLELRVGARVMAVKNDPQRRWINGSLGTVTRLGGSEVFVRFDRSRDEHMIGRASWDKIRQVWNATTQRIENEVIGSYLQVPLTPAWAITIHKAQGLSLDDVRIDLGSGAFAPGQAYVALSRARTLGGLSFTRALRATDLQTDPMLLGFMNFTTGQGIREDNQLTVDRM